MKKYIIYILILISGLVLGYLFFGTGDVKDGKEETEVADEHDHEGETTQMWTCSMHPQIMQPEPGDCPICGMELIPADANADGLSVDEFKMTNNAMALANIQTITVGDAGAAENTLSLSGKIQVNEEANAVQVAYFAGRIERLNVSFTGENVNRGQLLATIYSPQLVAAQQELLTAAKMKESQPALYNAVRNKLKLWKLSDAQINSIEEAGQVKENFPVFATVSGTVTEKMVQEGDYVEQGQPMFKLANLNSVWAVFDAYENQISGLEEGQKIIVTTNAYPDKELEAIISFIDPVLNTASRTLRLRAVLDNENENLKPGMFVKAKLERNAGQEQESTLSIPKTAVMWTGERSLVYVKTSRDKPVFEMREIELGATLADTYEVLSGLEGGEEIVANGTFTVDAAAQLQGKKSMMNQGKKKEDSAEMQMNLPDSFQKDFTGVLSAYLDLKDAFVNTNVEETKTAASKMLQQTEILKISNLGTMETQHLKKIRSMLEAISVNDNIENQRDHFIVLSENIIAFASNMETFEKPVYIQHCPMVNNNKGADWLSLSEEIRNPYFGEVMMNCGDTQRKL
ncbi:efflux RND transporter periplasmic adaptor subunit [Salegentibacter salegens]|uniref:Membrane fusion protein, Cu(I)/Ag(I) efflux system n=1 Tax=Salegentibacter salegens TaxID=143223 RepID=A0A1M7N813_9FLAO|nr:efflux RND transporter periplasmic adaptor subunit [Salegentibacter salegens]PRX45686.1 Cu(I)/Ag(I) efflux system membrane fusion protein [Salegentibacter salegens]SHM99750.1 membrane fusion protein, Cu(I)/Ag(I) efflux system [Salegentibacter salegens]